MAAGEKADPTSPGKKGVFRGLTTIVLLAFLAAAVYIYTQLPGQQSAEKVTEDKVAVLEARLQNLETSSALYADRLNKLEKQAEANAHASAANAAELADRKAAAPAVPTVTPAPDANATAATVSPAVPPVPNDDTKRIESLEKELATLKASTPLQDSEHVAHSIKLLSSYHRLSDKILSGKPFTDELSALEDGLNDSTSQNKALSQLATYAETGVPTQAELITSFDNSVEQLTTTQAVAPAEAGAWDRFVFNIAHLVRVRRIDEVQQGKDADSIIGRASAHLDKGEIEAAYSEISSLPEALRSDFSGWMEDAQIAIDTPGLISQLEEQVMQQVFSNTPKEAAPAPIVDKGIGIQ